MINVLGFLGQESLLVTKWSSSQKSSECTTRRAASTTMPLSKPRKMGSKVKAWKNDVKVVVERHVCSSVYIGTPPFLLLLFDAEATSKRLAKAAFAALRCYVLDCSHALGLPSFVFIVITDLLAHLDVGPISATESFSAAALHSRSSADKIANQVSSPFSVREKP